MKATWIIKLKRPVVHVAGHISHVYMTHLDAGRFYEEMEDRRKAEVMPKDLGVRRYDMCRCGTC